VRLEKLVQVIANELEPIRAAARVVREVVNLDEPHLQRHVAAVLRERDRVLFRDEYARFHDPAVSKPEGYGEPFFLDARRPRSGIVLVHGYLACPEQMRPLANALNAAGHVVYGVRLDGHGTAPVQLRDVHLPEWLDTIAQAHAIVRRHAPRVIVGGFSLGGVLSALHAAKRGDDVAGLFTINAPMILRNRWAPLVPTVLKISRMASRLGAERDLAELNNASETPDLNYETDYLHGIQELRTAMRDCRRKLHAVTARSLIVQTEDDPVVHPSSADVLARGLTHVGGPRPMVARLPGRRHVVIVDEDREPYIARVARFLELFDSS
jgi:esterase/lipase